MTKTRDHDSKLSRTRRAIAAQVRSLRRARGWTQAELAAKLGLSQSRLSELEAGDGSFAAEHLLTVLALFNVDLAGFGVEEDDDGDLQNALVRHGAKHLRERSEVVPSGRYTRPADAVRTVLLEPRSERWLTALAPVVVWSIDELALPPLQHDLAVAGVPNRLGWLVENVVAATRSTTAPAGPWRQRSRRAEVVLAAFLAHVEPPASPAPDPLDRAIRSPKTWQEVWSAASPLSRRWGVVTALQPDDFARSSMRPMHPIDEFLRDVDAAWTPGDRRIRLPLFGSAALFLQTDYVRGTKDGDILETQEVAAVRERLLALAGRDSALHRRHRIYLEVVGSGIPFLPPGAEWSPRDLGLSHFDLEVLSVTDVVVTKLKRFHGDDRADVSAMVEGGHVEHARLVRRVRDAVDWFRFDARADLLPRFVANFHTVERDYFGVAETRVELPDDLER